MEIKISEGNRKLGKIPNISLTPIESCPPGVLCKDDCYCQKAMRLYPSAAAAWANNLAVYREDPAEYFVQVQTYLHNKKPELFRWHVAGDIPDWTYFALMKLTAELHPETKFLVYTKNFRLAALSKFIPRNLSVILSMWPGAPVQEHLTLRRAWCQNGTEERVPAGAIPCPGQCYACAQCWNPVGEDIVFHKH